MDQPLSRRAWLTALASGAGAVAAVACNSEQGATELTTTEGKVLQWRGEDLLVLVSGYEPRYRAGDLIKVTVLVNNQTMRLAQVRVRTRLLTRGDQPVAEAEVTTLNVRAEDASSVERQLQTARTLVPGEYVLNVEIPPWRMDGRETGRLVTLRTTLQVTAA